MSQRNDPSAEMCELLALLREDQLTADPAQRLAELIHDDPSARRIYIEHITTCASLRWYLSGSDENPEIALLASTENILALLEKGAAVAQREAEERARIKSITTEKSLAFRRHGDRKPRSGLSVVPWNNAYAMVASVAAALIVCVLLLVERGDELLVERGDELLVERGDELLVERGDEPFFVAKIVAESDPVWSNIGAAMPPETGLREGEMLDLKSGLLEIEFGDGAWVILEGPAQFKIQSRGAGVLQRGKLVGRVTEEAVGFIIETPALTLVDLGTEFGVEVESSGATQVDTFDGLVELRLPVRGTQSSRSVQLIKDQAARFDPAEGTLTRNSTDAERFVQSIEGGHSSGVFSDKFDPESAHTYWDGTTITPGSIWDGVMVAALSEKVADRIDAGITNHGVLTISVSNAASDGSVDTVRDENDNLVVNARRPLMTAGLFLRVTGDFDVKVEMPAPGTAQFQTHSLGAFSSDRKDFVHIDNIAGLSEHVRFRAFGSDGPVVAGGLAIPQKRWFRLTRTTDMFRAYYGDDGTHWTEVGSGIARSNLPATLHVGLLTWPFYADTAFEAQFDNFEIMIPGGTAEERREISEFPPKT